MSYENFLQHFEEDSLRLEKQKILGLLEREGWNEQVKELVTQWTVEMETRSVISSREMIRFNFERAELYETMGEINDMFECLDQARYQIEQEMTEEVTPGDWNELHQTILVHIEEMEKKYPA